MIDKWILNEAGEPVPEPDLMKWATWYEESCKDNRRVVQQDLVQRSRGRRIGISTIFVSLDQGRGLSEAPILWETMAFRKRGTALLNRYTSKESAAVGHNVFVTLATTLPDNARRVAVRDWHNRRHSHRRRR